MQPGLVVDGMTVSTSAVQLLALLARLRGLLQFGVTFLLLRLDFRQFFVAGASIL